MWSFVKPVCDGAIDTAASVKVGGGFERMAASAAGADSRKAVPIGYVRTACHGFRSNKGITFGIVRFVSLLQTAVASNHRPPLPKRVTRGWKTFDVGLAITIVAHTGALQHVTAEPCRCRVDEIAGRKEISILVANGRAGATLLTHSNLESFAKHEAPLH